MAFVRLGDRQPCKVQDQSADDHAAMEFQHVRFLLAEAFTRRTTLDADLFPGRFRFSLLQRKRYARARRYGGRRQGG
jgi:hypothetical protein